MKLFQKRIALTYSLTLVICEHGQILLNTDNYLQQPLLL